MSMRYGTFVTRTLAEAADIARRHVAGVREIAKQDGTVVTAADLEIGQHILARVRAAYPDHNVVDEEAGCLDQGSDHTWVVDPLDGTANFAAGLPLYGIMIGLLWRGQPIAGGMALPAFGDILVAEKGQGTLRNDQPLRVTQTTDLAGVLIAYGFLFTAQDTAVLAEEARRVGLLVRAARDIRTSNCLFDTVMVAQGSYGAHLSLMSRIWDNVAQHIIIEEAGGVYTDFYGQPMDYTRPLTRYDQNYSFCAAARSVYPGLRETISRIAASTVEG